MIFTSELSDSIEEVIKDHFPNASKKERENFLLALCDKLLLDFAGDISNDEDGDEEDDDEESDDLDSRLSEHMSEDDEDEDQ